MMGRRRKKLRYKTDFPGTNLSVPLSQRERESFIRNLLHNEVHSF